MPEDNTNSQHLIEEILADLSVYSEPKMLRVGISELLNIGSVNMSGVEKYRELLSNLRYAWKKCLRYTQYFEEFYPPANKIEKFEALYHHIHAYLQDMTILKNKTEVLLGEMKNDIKKIAVNRREIDAFFKSGIEKTAEVFSQVSKHRHAHTHRGTRFFDGDLLKAENAHGTLELFTTGAFKGMLNPDYREEFLAKLQKEKEESFESAKKNWVEMAKRNDEQTSGYLD